ncbi:MAG: hypothetical protein U0V72_11400 [Cytophagales bacterium]
MLVALSLSSCMPIAYTVDHATNNPIGTKVSTTTVKFFQRKVDFSYSGAAKKGNIQKIGTTQTKVGGFITISKMTVTGE